MALDVTAPNRDNRQERSPIPLREAFDDTSLALHVLPRIVHLYAAHAAGRWRALPRFDWRQALTVVQLKTFIRWQQQAFRVFWWWTSRHGRPPIPRPLQALIRQMACEDPTWGHERIANELLLKLGLRVSPRTVRKYLPRRLGRGVRRFGGRISG
jgi:putative transposase